MQGTKLSYQERKCKLYNEFDKFTSVKGVSLHEYYLRFAQLIDDMHTIGMTMQQVQFPQLDLGLAVPVFVPGDDLIAYLNKSMSFISTVVASRFRQPTTNSEHLPIQETKLSLKMAGLLFNKFKGDMVRVLLGEGHMARQSTQPKRPRIYAWFKEKMLLTDDLDVYDSDCDDISSAKMVLMANLSSYASDILFEVPPNVTSQNDNMLNQSVQETQYFKQSLIDYVLDNDITSDSNIISYKQYL
ncbi:hypothetical protein Tco_0871195 [Tanacetum coccineum]